MTEMDEGERQVVEVDEHDTYGEKEEAIVEMENNDDDGNGVEESPDNDSEDGGVQESKSCANYHRGGDNMVVEEELVQMDRLAAQYIVCLKSMPAVGLPSPSVVSSTGM